MPHSISPHLDAILKATSRAFYLTLAVLPAGAREPLSLAYLLARAADTVADSDARSDAERAEVLRLLQAALSAPSPPEGLAACLEKFHSAHLGERRLLLEVPTLLELLHSSDRARAIPIQGVVHTLIEGMLWDQQLFGQGRADGLSTSELERYTYLVAGCVGPFWSHICAQDDPRLQHLKSERIDEIAVEFGKALQYTNILRDLPRDQESGRYYLPPLSTPNFSAHFRRAALRGLDAFAAAREYPMLFPGFYLRHRLAVLLPLVLGLRTLERLFQEGGPRPGRRTKVTRGEVMLWVLGGACLVTNSRLLRATLAYLENRARRALDTMESDA